MVLPFVVMTLFSGAVVAAAAAAAATAASSTSTVFSRNARGLSVVRRMTSVLRYPWI